MKGTKASLRYAKAILSLAKEMNVLEAVNKDMEHIASVCGESRDLLLFLKSPVVKTDDKEAVLGKIFTELSDLTKQFLTLMTRKKRAYLIADITKAFHRLYLQDQNIVSASVRSAIKLDDATRAKIISKITGEAKSVELHEHVDPSLIGGFIVRVGDTQVDASVSSKFNKLKQRFADNSFTSKI
jgi:F-type H+-transporting ATPase subunit delta